MKFEMLPAIVTRPMEWPPLLVNHMFPSDPAAIPIGELIPPPMNGVIAPVGVMRAMDAL